MIEEICHLKSSCQQMFHYSIIRLKSKAGLSRDFKAGKICY